MNHFVNLPYISFSLLAIKKENRIGFIKENNKYLYVDYLHIDISDLENSISLEVIRI